jgi:ubiquitin-conjugating enzyme E2 Z
MASNTVTKETTTRLLKDIKEILNFSNNNSNIFYQHDDEHMLTGYAIIVGPSDTPYEYGFYMFKFDFPYNYPYSPPKVTYLTNDGNVRYHPNFYKNGTCCLSILNTWRGEQWTSCQTILSVLLSITSLLQNDPLLQEPGIRKGHPDLEKYNSIISYKNIDFSIIQIIKMTSYDPDYDNDSKLQMCIHLFKNIILESFSNNRANILDKAKKLSCNSNKMLTTSMYQIKIFAEYKNMLETLLKIEI